MRRLMAVGAVAVVAGVLWTTSRDAPPASPLAPSAKRVVGFINYQRALHGLSEVSTSPRLTATSRTWSSTLVSTGSFAHATLRPGRRWSWLAETLYKGPGGPVRAWLRSPPHRAILLSPKAELVGVGRSGDVWTARFATK